MKIMTKEDYLSIIKKFREIQITKICKDVEEDYPNIISGKSSTRAYKKVVTELIRQINRLFLYCEHFDWEYDNE